MKHITIKLMVISILVLFTTMIVSSQTGLRNVFSNPICDHACFLTVEPGRTNAMELQNILNGQGLNWIRNELGLSGQVVTYSVPTNSFSAPIVQDIPITFWAGQSLETIVGTIQIPIEPTPFNNVIAEYGSPTVVLDIGNATAIVYQSDGIVFISSPDDNTSMIEAELRTPEGITNYYLGDPMIVPVVPCSDPTQPCSVPTTMSTPICNLYISPSVTGDLINAITIGNTFGSPYTICLTNSTYTLSQVDNSSNGDNGLPVITGDITIIGNGATITRDGAAPAFRFFKVNTSASLTLENVTLSNGRSSDGGAILNDGTVTVNNSTFSNNVVTVDDGGAIDNWGIVTVQNSVFDNNSAADDGGAIWNDGTLTISDSTFTNNQVMGADSVGGAIRNFGTSDITNSTFSSNTAYHDGGAIANDETLNLVDSLLNLNTTSSANVDADGGAILNYGDITLNNTQVVDNQASDGGGGLYTWGGTVTIVNGSRIANNDALAGNGGGLYLGGNNVTTISDSFIENNRAVAANQVGGGIYALGDLSLSNTVINANAAHTGGGLYYNNSLGTPQISNGTIFMNNTAANNGAGIYLNKGVMSLNNAIVGNNTAGNNGGGLYSTATLDISNSIISTNEATNNNGGGIRNTGTITLSNVNLDGNSANTVSGRGGGLYNSSGTVTVINGTISQNSANDGGGIYIASDSVSLSGTTLSTNNASDDGGAVYIVNGGGLTTDSSTFDSNSAVDDGGAVDNRGTFSITNSQFVNNSSNDGGAIDTKTAGTNAIHYSCISGNIASVDSDGIRSSEATLNAENNWWGAIDGPSGAGSGSGDEVSINVDFDPYDSISCENALGAQGASIASMATLDTMQFMDTELPMELPYIASQEDEAVWQVTGTWDLSNIAGRPNPTWVVDAVPRQQESILELIFPVDLGNRPNPILSFQERLELAGTDAFTIEVLAENATEWLAIDSQSAVSSDWHLHTVDLSAYRGQVIRLRARLVTGDELVTDEVSTGVWLDEVMLDYSSSN